MITQAVLKNGSHPEYGVATIPFPIPHDQYDKILEMLEEIGIGDAVQRDCMVEEINGGLTVLKCLEGNAINIDEMNYLAKRIESFDGYEEAQFQGMASRLGTKDMTDLINLTFCCQKATVVTNFNNLAQVGYNHYLTTKGGAASTEELANDMRVMGIAATGSGERLEDLMFLQVDDELKFINEIKGMNPAIVYRPSDMKAAVRDIIDSAFSYSGQRLHSCSKVIITVDDQKKFMEVLSENMKDLRIGDPVDDTSFAGPLISMDAAKRFSEISLENMPFIVAKAAPVIDAPGKNYVAPIVVSGLDDDNDLNFMDSGLPILNIKVVNSIDAAFEEIEDTECGLSAGLFSKDPKVIDRFKKDVDVPLQYINSSSRALPAAHGAELSNFVL